MIGRSLEDFLDASVAARVRKNKGKPNLKVALSTIRKAASAADVVQE